MRVEFNHPDFPSGIEFDVGGLLLLNGEPRELTDEEIESYEARNSKSAKEGLSGVMFVTVDGQSYEPPVTVVVDETPEDGLESEVTE